MKTGRGIPGRKVIIYMRCSGNHNLRVFLEQVKTGGKMVRGKTEETIIMISNT